MKEETDRERRRRRNHRPEKFMFSPSQRYQIGETGTLGIINQ
jgi:hypothetical protein